MENPKKMRQYKCIKNLLYADTVIEIIDEIKNYLKSPKDSDEGLFFLNRIKISSSLISKDLPVFAILRVLMFNVMVIVPPISLCLMAFSKRLLIITSHKAGCISTKTSE
jgi:hypothetical protein